VTPKEEPLLSFSHFVGGKEESLLLTVLLKCVRAIYFVCLSGLRHRVRHHLMHAGRDRGRSEEDDTLGGADELDTVRSILS